ncbi:ATP-binding protein [Botrimarina sp.]|uniref:ATP-binding protein n=1 Tax=Botrimarina sp. TaxID=2795802 RepID=UPI0032EDD3D4
MPNRGLKRVLGETSLERKCLWWFGIALAVLLSLSFYWSGLKLREIVYENDLKLGKEWVNAALVERHFEAFVEPSPDEKQSFTPGDVRFWEDMLDSMISGGRDADVDFDSYAILPQDPILNPDEKNPPTQPGERELLARYDAADRAEAEPSLVDARGGKLFRFYQPIYAKQSCVSCHSISMNGGLARPGLKEGDLMAVMRIEIERDTGEQIAMYEGIMWAVAVMIGVLSMFLLYFIIRLLIVKPVQHLRDVANAIREGDTAQRADIQTGDEFEDLAAAFNRMLRQLLSQQNALESVNHELDAKVDELAQMNLRLFEMNRLKSDFLATMSHELRTPLNSILGFSEVLGAVDSLDAKQQRYVTNIQRSGKMLLEMINDILDLAKLESGRMDATPSELPLASIITAQCDMARPLAERKHIDLDAVCPTGVPPLRQDHAKLQQILNNLLSNAIKFTPEGGRIMVRARREESSDSDGAPRAGGDSATLVVEVEDTGIGINEADQGIIFEKFRQGASAAPGGDAMTREQGGTGLGLSIVRELCRLLDGEVTVRSVSGKGSTFTVRLPWRLPDRTDLDAELNREVAELTRPASGALPAPAAPHPAASAAG